MIHQISRFLTRLLMESVGRDPGRPQNHPRTLPVPLGRATRCTTLSTYQDAAPVRHI
jgi:hypothetical protein